MRPAMNTANRWLFVVIALLSIAGIVVSSVSLHHHYGTSQGSFCDLSATFNCDIVNRSVYSTIAGIPDALIGILGYGALLVFSTLRRHDAQTPAILLAGSLVGLGFALYLTYIEKYVLATWCILCLSSLTLISLITITCAGVVINSKRRA